ncbi:gp565 [Bacillus phage G]|uniref:Gp565 n=1 Tax=Bacillus phage G TaxID=2884420 RepID=G3MAU5_9CAUD|nr:gp565 [Bacillus phage G]AEO93811.1 gp565 [Bacillus phage G]
MKKAWYTLNVVQGKLIKERWKDNDLVTFILEEEEGACIKVSLMNDIEDETWYEVYNDMGKVKLNPIKFICSLDEFNKEI